MANETSFHIPVRPYSPIDALNRKAAALGSPGYAMACSHASYNGHHVSVYFNDYRRYWLAEHYFGERVVHARGSFSECLQAAIREYDRGDLGSSVEVTIPETDQSSIELAEACDRLQPGSLWVRTEEHGRTLDKRGWWTWRHDVAIESVRDSANPRALVLIFDWKICEAAQSREEYETAVKAKHGRIWT